MAGIFRAYDIRGIVGPDLNASIMRRIGFSYAQHMYDHELLAPGDVIPVGADLRTTSPELKAAFIEGARAAGLGVVDIGTISTPHAYFAVAHYKYKGGAMITASHNPKEYNGVKLMKAKGECISGEDGVYAIEARVAALAATGDASIPKIPKSAAPVTRKDVTKDYEDWVVSKVKLFKKLNVIIDCGNGATSGFATHLLKRLGCTVTELYCEPDGTFPNHEPDPIHDKNIVELLSRVAKAKAAGKPYDLGIAFDGDGDRVIFVDENGKTLRGDEALALLGAHEIDKVNAQAKTGKGRNAKPPQLKFITEVVATRGPIQYLEKHGGSVKMVRVGHSYIYSDMLTEKATLAGEYSGHLFYRENYGVDDAMFGAAKMVELVSEGKGIAHMRKGIPTYFATPSLRPPVDDAKKFIIAGNIVESLKKKYGTQAVTIDGVRLELPNAWGLLRASNTGPEFVVRFEGKTQKDLDNVMQIFRDELAPYGVKV